MSNPSYTSSSNPVEKKPQTIKVALLTLIILLCVGLPLSAFRDSLEKIKPRSYLTPVYSYLDLDKPKDMKVIFLGSSRIESCIKRDLFAKLLGIEQSKILILSVAGAGLWDEFSMCNRHPELFESSPLVIIEVEPWMFNENSFSNKDNLFLQPGFFTWASFQDRLKFPDVKTKFLLLADYFWPFSESRLPSAWADIIHLSIKGIRSAPYNPEGQPKYHYMESAYQAVANDPHNTVQFQFGAGLNNFKFSKYKAEYLKRLITLARKKSKKIIILQPPLRNEYLEFLNNNPKYAETYIQYLQFIGSLVNENTHSIIWETTKDCGLNDTVFIDYGHFNVQGAYIFTERVFIEMKNRGIIVSHKNDEME